MAQQDQQHLGSPQTQVQSPAWYSGLRIQHCCSCCLGRSWDLDLISGTVNSRMPQGVGGQEKEGKKKITVSWMNTADIQEPIHRCCNWHQGQRHRGCFSLLGRRAVMLDMWRRDFYTWALFKTISNPIMFPWILAPEEYSKCHGTRWDGIQAKVIQNGSLLNFHHVELYSHTWKTTLGLGRVPEDRNNLRDGGAEYLWRKDADAGQVVL